MAKEPDFEIVSDGPYTGVGTITIPNGRDHKCKFYAALFYCSEFYLVSAHEDKQTIKTWITNIERIATGDDSSLYKFTFTAGDGSAKSNKIE